MSPTLVAGASAAAEVGEKPSLSFLFFVADTRQGSAFAPSPHPLSQSRGSPSEHLQNGTPDLPLPPRPHARHELGPLARRTRIRRMTTVTDWNERASSLVSKGVGWSILARSGTFPLRNEIFPFGLELMQANVGPPGLQQLFGVDPYVRGFTSAPAQIHLGDVAHVQWPRFPDPSIPYREYSIQPTCVGHLSVSGSIEATHLDRTPVVREGASSSSFDRSNQCTDSKECHAEHRIDARIGGRGHASIVLTPRRGQPVCQHGAENRGDR